MGGIPHRHMDEEILGAGKVEDREDFRQSKSMLPEGFHLLAAVLAQAHGHQSLEADAQGFGGHPSVGFAQDALGPQALDPGQATGRRQTNGRSQLLVGNPSIILQTIKNIVINSVQFDLHGDLPKWIRWPRIHQDPTVIPSPSGESVEAPVNHRPVKPQTEIFSKGYDPQRSEGAAVPPVFRTSTFLFKTAEEGKRAFEIAYGLSPMKEGESPALIYTRVNNPNTEILEDKVVCWDGAEEAAIFGSGMGAVSSTCLAFLRPGDTLVFSDPVYGGTEYFFRHMLPLFGIKTKHFPAGATKAEMEALIQGDPTVKAIYLESPANPTIVISDIEAARELADQYSTPDRKIILMVDNTFMGPIFCQPLKHGADLVIYSATKFFGGHSDLVAGITMGSKALMGQVKVFRTILGSIADPDTTWLIHRSLATLQIRMEKQQESALKLVDFLLKHPKVYDLSYPGLPQMGERQIDLWKKQFTGTGSLITFKVKGGEAEAFRMLDAIHHMKLAVSLGGVESLIQHPSAMTHSDMAPHEKAHAGITDNMIRISVGLEDADDLIADLEQALAKI